MSDAAVIDIYNLALSHVGNGKDVQSLTEATAERRACDRFYVQARDEVLRDFPWGFAKKTADLQLVEADPTTEWGFSYRVPSDCLRVRRIVSGARVETTLTRIPFALAGDDDGALLYTDQEDAVVEYTMAITDPTRFPADVVQTIALLLASYVAPRVTGGDPNKLGARAFTLYQMRRAGAQANAVNEETPDPDGDASFISARN